MIRRRIMSLPLMVATLDRLMMADTPTRRLYVV